MIRGILYVILGWISFKFAFGWSTGVVDISGVVASLHQMSWGRFISVAVIVGLASYSLWGFVRVFYDPFGKGTGVKGYLLRGGYLISAFSYLAVCLFAIRLSLQIYSFGLGEVSSNPIVYLVSQWWGEVVFRLIGLIVIGASVMRLISGLKKSFVREVDIKTMTDYIKKIIIITGVAGSIARSVVYGVIGYFIWYSPQRMADLEDTGVDDALYFIYQIPFPYGRVALMVVSAGLILFGLHSWLMGWRLKYRMRINEERLVDE